MTREEAIEVYHGLINTKIKEAFEFFAPELAESEDERIRKEIISIVKAYRENCIDEGTHRFDDCLSWLEKQKEQGECPEYCVRSHCMGCSIYEKQKDFRKLYEDIAKSEWFKKAYHGKSLGSDDEQKEQNPKEVDESTKRLNDNWMKQHFDDYEEQKPAEWSEEDEKMLNEICANLYALPETREKWQRFLKSLRPSWKPSEQEKGALRTAIYVLTNERNFPKTAVQLQNILSAFEGKESRKDWKPSSEQIYSLGTVVKGMGDISERSTGYHLKELYEQLKKL